LIAVGRLQTAVGRFLVVAVSKMAKFAFMWMKKISRHLFFWISYTVILLYNELFLSASFSKDPGMGLFCTGISGTFDSFVGENSIGILYSRKHFTGLVPKPE
jgi:hypothetical protein